MLTDKLSCICMLKNESYHFFFYYILNQKKKTELNKLDKLEYSKTPSQMSSYAHKHVFLHLHAQTDIDTLLY